VALYFYNPYKPSIMGKGKYWEKMYPEQVLNRS
jgi:hypothetical protein